MTLYDYIKTHKDDEVTVFDKDYDLEIYFYKDLSDDDWDKAMLKISKLLEVVETGEYGVTVNLSELIEKKIDKVGKLFIDDNIDEIMGSMESIFAGNVSEQWMKHFADNLE